MDEPLVHAQPSDTITPDRLAASGRAVADLAHLVKNIIQVMGGCGEIIDLAIQTKQFDRVEKAWRLYQPGFWRLKKFQLDLIQYTKEYPLDCRPCHIRTCVAAATKPLAVFFDKRNVRFSSEVSDNLPEIIADERKIGDAVQHLLITAVDNLQDEPGEVTLKASMAEDGKAVVIAVCDSGPTMDAAQRDALLTPHERCRNMLGSGLEIPLAKQIAADHGGTLTLDTTSQHQNRITMTLPLCTP